MRKARLGAAYRGPQQEVGEKFGLGLSVDEIAGRRKLPAVALARRRFALIAARYFDHSLKSIGEVLAKSPSQVSRWLGRETALYAMDPGEAARIEEITAEILRQQVTPVG